MIASVFLLGLPALLATFAGIAEATQCNATSPCPSSAPCCSEFGFCGTGYFCLGGCNPFASKAFDSCRPAPLCKDKSYTFTDQSRILSNHTLFDGNASSHDWIIESGNIQVDGGDLALTLTEQNGGTRISSTRYVHYGTITAKLKTGKWAGVVTAFITMSDIKDEIDWEFPGAATTEGQSNFFWQGVIPTPSQGGVHNGLSDTFSNYHEYTIDWQPDALTWAIDGKTVRTVKKSDTVDDKGVPHYPNTPSRVQFSIWPAGISSSAKGTVDWAGGMIDWNDPDYKATGQFYAKLNSVSIKCTNAQQVTAGSNITSYVYAGTNATSSTPTIVYSNRTSLLNGSGRMIPALGGVSGLMAALGLGSVVALNALFL
ncbi:glycoside hydrolase family 16 protein [Panaeolus papilionaceus]|nr:glycoside hydrolase family 16 protein [Panaeolus papilionaceus]